MEWARRAEARGFSTLSVSDRLVWQTPEPLTTLAAAAGATSRIQLLTSVLLAPLRANHALFAKTVATLDQLAGPGRLRLGLSPGSREDDFDVSGLDWDTRGKQFDQLLAQLAEPCELAPATDGGPPLLFGGGSKATLRRIASHGTGWIAGDATIQDIEDFAPRVRQAWTDAGRSGKPRVIASVMYALGPGAEAAVADAIGAYYAFAGEEYAQYGISIAHTSPNQITEAVAAFERAGCDELIFMGNDPNPDQVDLLADLVMSKMG